MIDKYADIKGALYVAEFNHLYNAYVAYLRDTGVVARVAKNKLTAATQKFVQACLANDVYATVSLESPELGTEKLNAVLLHNTVANIQKDCVHDFCDIAVAAIDDYPVSRVTLNKYLPELRRILHERKRDTFAYLYKLRSQA